MSISYPVAILGDFDGSYSLSARLSTSLSAMTMSDARCSSMLNNIFSSSSSSSFSFFFFFVLKDWSFHYHPTTILSPILLSNQQRQVREEVRDREFVREMDRERKNEKEKKKKKKRSFNLGRNKERCDPDQQESILSHS